MFNIKHIYYEEKAIYTKRGAEVFGKYPDATKTKVDSHWKIPELHQLEQSADNWNKIKREVLVLGTKKKLYCRENGRSTDFIAPSHTNGCAMSCAYCYVARRKGYANPVTLFTNIDEIIRYTREHAQKLEKKEKPNQCDPTYWTYDIGENNDCSLDDMLSDNVKNIIEAFRYIPNAKACFATKFVNRKLLEYDPQNKTRIRFSLMPQSKSKILDVRTSPISDRIQAINDFLEAGYEVHLNFSPIVVYDGWTTDWKELLEEVNDCTDQAAKDQLKCEVIFLTHNEELHQINKRWHPKAEELLWTPNWQEEKISQTGGKNVRYKWQAKNILKQRFLDVLQETSPYINVRYAF